MSDMYLGIGLTKANEEFNKAFRFLATSRAEFMGYDKETKTWIWL